MAIAGLLGVMVALCSCAASAACGLIAFVPRWREGGQMAASLFHTSRTMATLAAVACTASCIVLTAAFITGDSSLLYVAENLSDAGGSLGAMLRVAGFWAGPSGSMLLWAWLVSLLSCALMAATRKGRCRLDSAALAVQELVAAAFLAAVAFSPGGSPFASAAPGLDGMAAALTGAGQGMNPLLEHWGMIVHPPLLFIAYAALTIPFSYAVAPLIASDGSGLWARRAAPWLLGGWLSLTAGIGFGALWANDVDGWGGYWSWDAVENVSLVLWLVCLTAIHILALCRGRGLSEGWGAALCSLAFASVLLSTFTTRSGIVRSVHSYGSGISGAWLYLELAVTVLIAGLAAAAWHRSAAKGEGCGRPATSLGEYVTFLGSLLLLVSALLLAYLTLAPSFPAWLPFGGWTFSPSFFEALARSLGVVCCLLMVVGLILQYQSRTKSEPPSECAEAKGRRLHSAGVHAVHVFAIVVVLGLAGSAAIGEFQVVFVGMVWLGFVALLASGVLCLVGHRHMY